MAENKIAGAYSVIEIEAKTTNLAAMVKELDRLTAATQIEINFAESLNKKLAASNQTVAQLTAALNANKAAGSGTNTAGQGFQAMAQQAAQGASQVLRLTGLVAQHGIQTAQSIGNTATNAWKNLFQTMRDQGSQVFSFLTGQISDMMKMAQQARDFSNATGGESTANAALFLANSMIGVGDLNQMFNNTSLSVALQQIANQDEIAAQAQIRFNDAVEDAGRIIDRVKADNLREVADATADAARASEDLRTRTTRSERDSNRDRERQQVDFQREMMEAQLDAADRIVDLNRTSGYKIIDLERDLNDRKLEYAQDFAGEQTKLLKKLADIELEYLKKRESLFKRYFDADPFLRPFIQDQIDALNQQKGLEEADARTSFDIQKAEAEKEIALIEEKIRREREARADAEIEIRATLARREEDLIRSNERQTADAKLAWERQVEDARKAQQDIDRALAERLAAAELRLQRADEDALERIEAAKQKITEEVDIRPVVTALEKLGFSMKDAMSLLEENPAKFLEEFADKFALLENGAEKTKIINDLFGFFGLQVRPLIDQLGTMGKEGRKALEDMLGNLTNLTKNYDKVLEGQIAWNMLMLILKDVAYGAIIPLIPMFVELSKTLQDWYATVGKTDVKDKFGVITDFLIEKAGALIKFIKGEGSFSDLFLAGDATKTLETEIAKLFEIVKREADKAGLILFGSGSLEEAGSKLGKSFGAAFSEELKNQVKGTVFSSLFGDYNYSDVTKTEGSFAAGLGETFEAGKRSLLRSLGILPDAKDVDFTVEQLDRAGKSYQVISKTVKDEAGNIVEKTRVWKDDQTGLLNSVTERYDATGRKVQEVFNAIQNESTTAQQGVLGIIAKLDNAKKASVGSTINFYEQDKKKVVDALMAPYVEGQDKFRTYWDTAYKDLVDQLDKQLGALKGYNKEVEKEGTPIRKIIEDMQKIDILNQSYNLGYQIGKQMMAGLDRLFGETARQGLGPAIVSSLLSMFGGAPAGAYNGVAGAGANGTQVNMTGDINVNTQNQSQADTVIGWLKQFFSGGV
jgi:hypothetical protein